MNLLLLQCLVRLLGKDWCSKLVICVTIVLLMWRER